MLHLLTKYLLQYRTVTIPHVGTINIVQYPSQLDVADKRLQPPSFSFRLKGEEDITDHQLNFLSSFLQKENNWVLEELKQFGDRLYDKINGPGFEWNGLGKLDRSTQSFPVLQKGLTVIAAERVIRENPDHQVLVGDRQTSSLAIADEKLVEKEQTTKRSSLIVIGWILLLLSILAIGFFAYKGKFRVNSSGSKMPASGFMAQ